MARPDVSAPSVWRLRRTDACQQRGWADAGASRCQPIPRFCRGGRLLDAMPAGGAPVPLQHHVQNRARQDEMTAAKGWRKAQMEISRRRCEYDPFSLVQRVRRRAPGVDHGARRRQDPPRAPACGVYGRALAGSIRGRENRQPQAPGLRGRDRVQAARRHPRAERRLHQRAEARAGRVARSTAVLLTA